MELREMRAFFNRAKQEAIHGNGPFDGASATVFTLRYGYQFRVIRWLIASHGFSHTANVAHVGTKDSHLGCQQTLRLLID
jgi:hypothetical protein